MSHLTSLGHAFTSSTRLKEENCDLPQVKVDEVLCFMCHIRSWTRRERVSRVRHHAPSTRSPKFRPTMQCHVGLYFLSNSFLMNAAMSFSMLYFSKALRRERRGGQMGDSGSRCSRLDSDSHASHFHPHLKALIYICSEGYVVCL